GHDEVVPDLLDVLPGAGVSSGTPLALVLAADGGLALAVPGRSWTWRPVAGATADGSAGPSDRAAEVARIERELSPRWVWWSARSTATDLVQHGVRVAACWDLAAVHR